MVFDKDLKGDDEVGVHPNDNTATVVISQAEFQRYLACVGNSYEYINLFEESE